ncbi:MAG: LPS assembly protein LptD [Verrucomicrobiae bacterium]|nr:LPS assembly protein LptD [Verrucomicrobiae bacterium]
MRPGIPTSLVFVFLVGVSGLMAREPDHWHVEALSPGGKIEVDLATGAVIATNRVMVRYGDTVLVADKASVNRTTGEAIAEGDVYIIHAQQVWVGQKIHYNFKTRQMLAERFRTSKWPVCVEAEGLSGDIPARVYYATNVLLTTEDTAEPIQKIRARSVKIVPGRYIEARDALLYIGSVPVFYLPSYSRPLDARANHFSLTPGYRSRFGPFALGRFDFFVGDQFDGALRLDYRLERGFGTGAEASYRLGRWGETTAKYYFLHDEEPEPATIAEQYPPDRHVFEFAYQSVPFTNTEVKAQVRYQSDAGVLKEFFERDYRRDPHPKTFADVAKFWENFSLDIYAQPRLNDFVETVERLPQIKLTGHRQQLGPLPVFYESESSFAYLRRRFAETNGYLPANFAAARADSFHQLVMPYTLFGWLNVTPRMGGRLTYYTEATGPGAATDEIYRAVFNTGVELTFKAWRTWPQARSGLLQVNGLRHIVEPALNYAYVPRPNRRPDQIPQFDYETASLCPLPIEFPAYNAIDSIDSQNVLRLGLRNRLQTKRNSAIEDLVNWDVYTDWRLDPRSGQSTFSDIYSALTIKPRAWLSLESETRFDTHTGEFTLARETVALQPGSTWSWGITYFYLREDLRPVPNAWGLGNNVINSAFFYRLDENWGFRLAHYIDLQRGKLQEHTYAVYRDLRSWTGAIVFRVREDVAGRTDFGVALTLSLKASPRFGLGTDTISPLSWL